MKNQKCENCKSQENLSAITGEDNIYICERCKQNQTKINTMDTIKEKLIAHIEFLKEQIEWAKEGYPSKCESSNASAEATMMHLGMEIKFLEKIILQITNSETP